MACYAAEVRAALDRWDRKVAATLKNEPFVPGSWELDVQKAKDAINAGRGENGAKFRDGAPPVRYQISSSPSLRPLAGRIIVSVGGFPVHS